MDAGTIPTRVVFFGSGAFGLPTLEALVVNHEIALVVSQPDRPSGRRQAMTATPIASYAAGRGIPVIKPLRVNEAAVVEQIRATGAEAFVVIAFGQKLGEKLLADRFAINLHGSLLPKYRGAGPIQWAMINDEAQTGVTVITLAQKMDAGLMLASALTPIDPHETAGELHDRLAELGPALVLRVLDDKKQGVLNAVPQDERLATEAPKLSKADGTVSFELAASAVRARVHGLTPWPGCTIRLDDRTLRLHRVEAINAGSANLAPGTILQDRTIACGSGAIRVLEVQPPGGKLMSFEAYCNGQPIRAGMKCGPASP